MKCRKCGERFKKQDRPGRERLCPKCFEIHKNTKLFAQIIIEDSLKG